MGNPLGLETTKSVCSCDSSPLLAIFLESKQNLNREIDYKENLRYGYVFASIPALVVSLKSKLKSKSKSFSLPLSSPSLWMDSHSSLPSPPLRKSFIWCSRKSALKKENKESPILGNDLDWGIKNDEFLSDLSACFVKEQEKILQKAMQEQEKVSRKVEKIVKWEKQVSMRISKHHCGALDDELRDD